MPYIAPNWRERFDPELEGLKRTLSTFDIKNEDRPKISGFLNYIISKLLWHFVSKRGGTYDAYNTAFGVLECVKMELYRRQTAPYEDQKIKLNGDVYHE